MRAMVVGISPDYNYPGSWDKWRQNNTYYASNLGASLIVRSIMKEFNADYIDDFSDITELRNKYDTCFLGLATHAHSNRDITYLTSFLEKLDIKTVIISLGISDYVENSIGYYKLDPSVIRLLEIASSGTKWIGVRGPYTTSILNQNGFKNVVPIGCPTLYSNLNPEFIINTKEKYTNPLVVFHRTIVDNSFDLINSLPLLGQDYEDEAFFTDRIQDDVKLQKNINTYYSNLDNSEAIIEMVKKHGIFTTDFSEWQETIASHDFVFGPRLHGCISSLLQGIPAIMTPRDLRVKEIVEFFKLPNIPYQELKNCKIDDIYKRANFQDFQDTYKYRYNNFLSFINENKLESQLKSIDNVKYTYTIEDKQTFDQINLAHITNLSKNQEALKKDLILFRISFYKMFFKLSNYKKAIKRIVRYFK